MKTHTWMRRMHPCQQTADRQSRFRPQHCKYGVLATGCCTLATFRHIYMYPGCWISGEIRCSCASATALLTRACPCILLPVTLNERATDWMQISLSWKRFRWVQWMLCKRASNNVTTASRSLWQGKVLLWRQHIGKFQPHTVIKKKLFFWELFYPTSYYMFFKSQKHLVRESHIKYPLSYCIKFRFTDHLTLSK